MLRKRILEIVILVISALIIIFISANYEVPVTITEENEIPIPEYIPKTEYGIIVDSLKIYRGMIKRNQFLADILLKYNVDYATIDLISKRSKTVFDVRKIRYGNNYSVICSNDSIEKVLYFVYESSPASYVVFDLVDSVHVHTGKKEIVRREKITSGIITSSLWNSMVDNETDPNLANELSEIYAWTIDFFGIQKGDNYKVIYDELFVDDQCVGMGKVLSAVFSHAGKSYYAFYFIQDSVGDYFDEDAGSMMRTFLKAPLRFKRISSRYSYSRLHPILKIRRPHLGMDYAAAYGTPVHAIGDGIITKAGRSGQSGKIVKIKHNGTYSTAYLHLSGYGKGIKKGVRIKQGDIIGYVGSTGLSTGPHLDFRFYRNGKAADPLKVKSPPAKPVDSTYLQEFNLLKDKMMEELKLIII